MELIRKGVAVADERLGYGLLGLALQLYLHKLLENLLCYINWCLKSQRKSKRVTRSRIYGHLFATMTYMD